MTFWAMLGFAAVLIGALFLANNLQPRQSAASSVRDRGGMERGFGTGLLVLIVGYSGSVVRARNGALLPRSELGCHVATYRRWPGSFPHY